jgi:hypothetical protein
MVLLNVCEPKMRSIECARYRAPDGTLKVVAGGEKEDQATA